MKRQGRVEIESLEPRIGRDESILLLGSCFADEIGSRLQQEGYKALTNPFGTIFNPISIANALERLGKAEITPFTEKDVMRFNYGANCLRYGSLFHNTKASRCTPSEFLADANNTLELSRSRFAEASTVIITLGTSWVFLHKALNLIVSNCHKLPANLFERYRLTLEETISTLRNALYHPHGTAKYPGKRFIFTVSPVRYLADGEHGNQISKATLLLAVEALLERGYIEYFPSYEIMMDELRDFRHYAEDTVHPSAASADYIYLRFKEGALL